MTPHVYAAARDTLIAAIPAIAEYKNIPLAPEEYPVVAELALGDFTPRDIRDLNCARLEVAEFAANAIHHALDLLFLARVIAARLAVEGKPVLGFDRLIVAARRGLKALGANDESTAFRWCDPSSTIVGLPPPPRALSVKLGRDAPSMVTFAAAAVAPANAMPEGGAP